MGIFHIFKKKSLSKKIKRNDILNENDSISYLYVSDRELFDKEFDALLRKAKSKIPNTELPDVPHIKEAPDVCVIRSVGLEKIEHIKRVEYIVVKTVNVGIKGAEINEEHFLFDLRTRVCVNVDVYVSAIAEKYLAVVNVNTLLHFTVNVNDELRI